MTSKNTKADASFGIEPAGGSHIRGYIFVGVFIGVIGLGAIYLLLNNQPQATQPTATAASTGDVLASVQTFPILSRDHIQEGQTHPAYNSNPPTNGWHYPQWADWGIYGDSIPDEYLIHNLEHGGIWISYRNNGDAETIGQLMTLVSNDSDRIIMTYRPQDDSAIAIAAWGTLLKLDQFDEASIKAFIQKYRYQGPENVP